MKKLGLGCLGIIIFSVFSVWLLLQLPAVKHPKVVQQAFEETRGRFDEHQAHIGEQENGYLDPLLLAYWGRANFEAEKNSEAGRVIEDWNDLFLGKEGISHWNVTNFTPKEIKVQEQFYELLPSLLGAFEKPYFVAPETSFNVANTQPDYYKFGRASTALSIHWTHLIQEGNVEQSHRILAALLNLGANLQGQGYIASEREAAQRFSLVWKHLIEWTSPTNDKFSSKDWLRISEACLTYLPDKRQSYHATQAITTHCIDLLESRGSKANLSLYRIFGVKRMLEREVRIYKNFGSLFLMASRSDTTRPHFLTLYPDTLVNRLLGKYGGKAQNLSMLYQPLEVLVRHQRTVLLGIGLSAGVLSYQKTFQRWPSSLAQLSELGIDVAKIKEWNTPEFSLNTSSGQARLSAKVRNSDLTMISEFRNIGSEGGWVSVENDRLIFHLK